LTWFAPSRDENAAGTVLREEEAALWTGSADDQPPELEAAVLVQGGRERGLILHKLMEEVLTGETQEEEAALTERAGHLIRALGQSPVADPATGLSAQELAACVARTWLCLTSRPCGRGFSPNFPSIPHRRPTARKPQRPGSPMH